MATQCEQVVKYMQDHGSITHLQASNDLGVMRLAARISDLRRRGYNISSRIVKGKNRNENPVHFAEYRLEE